MFKWGTIDLKVIVGTYEGPFPVLSVQEIPLLPSGTDKPASAIQTGGRLRKRAKMTIICDTQADYLVLYEAHLASTVRATLLKEGLTFPSMMISHIGPPVDKYLWLECELELMEV